MPPKPTCKVVKREGQRGARIDPKGCKVRTTKDAQGNILAVGERAAYDEVGCVLAHYVAHITKHLSAEQEQLYVVVAEARTERIDARAGLQGAQDII